MKILKLLNKKYFSILLITIFALNCNAEDKPVDIWNLEKNEIDKSLNQNSSSGNNNDEILKDFESSVYDMQSQKKNDDIKLEENIGTNQIELYGLYDPEDYDLKIDMWLNSDGDQIKKIFSKLMKMRLSEDATEILNISLLTNAYHPKKNITDKEFFELKSNWLIKNSNLDLIEDYLIKNQIFDLNPKLTKYLVDYYLSTSDVEKACEIFSKNKEPITDNYLSKFNIYCLILNKKNEEAQLIFDLKKEAGFKDKYFENKINFLFGYSTKVDKSVSQKSILDFHLAHKINAEFSFEPNEDTKKIIWKYLSSSNLLSSFQEIDVKEMDKIATIEKAVHNKNYPETDLFNLYKRFQFNINELLNPEDASKLMPNIQGRALIYQKILLESEKVKKLKLLKKLKDLFKKDDLNNAFDIELKKFLDDYNPTEIPDNLTSFYYTNIIIDNSLEKQIKFDKDILHQSRLVNYFNGDYAKSKIEKDVNNFLKKIKKNKKYYFSTKDKMFLESLKADGIKIQDKYHDIYQIDKNEIPTDIQVMINNDEKGMILLRIAEVLGQDNLEKIDDDTIYFIVDTLNQLNIDFIRNKILFKILPLKV
tara:strand:- start:326 stop:2098 length:1773 start_codon:yes stop_codon:yes gene_type:complete